MISWETNDPMQWAENEVALLLDSRRSLNNDEADDWENQYFEACCLSALKAYKVLFEDDHSGMSWNITANILKRLLEDKPLSPITGADFEDASDILDSPEWLHQMGLVSATPCTRMRGLYRYTYKNDVVEYKDINRTVIYAEGSDVPWRNSYISNIVDELYPIKMPYAGEKYIAYVKEDKSVSCREDYDCFIFKSLKHPDGTMETINRFFIDVGNGGWLEVSESAYNKFLGGK